MEVYSVSRRLEVTTSFGQRRLHSDAKRAIQPFVSGITVQTHERCHCKIKEYGILSPTRGQGNLGIHLCILLITDQIAEILQNLIVHASLRV